MHARFAFLPVLVWLAAAGATVTGRAREFSAQLGTTGSGMSLSSHYSWQLDYRESLNRQVAWSLGWINEGHTLRHHRDGLATQIWAVLPFRAGTFSLSFGAGAYHYFDTELLPGGTTVNTHGWTPVYSLAATYYSPSPWFLRLTANRINRSNHLETHSLVAGPGYAFGAGRPPTRPHARPAAQHPATDQELTLFVGQSIVNTARSEDALASAIEFRSALSPHFEWSAAWINEGDPQIIRRNGFASQLWLVETFLEKNLTLGLGLGPYLLFDRKRAPVAGQDNPRNLAALVSPSATLRLSAHWRARLTWHRVVSTYNRDADLFLVGLGYRWGAGG